MPASTQATTRRSCRGTLDELTDRRGFLDRELTEVEHVEAELHLGDCDYCRRRYRFEVSLRTYVQTTAAERMPAGLMDKLSQLRSLDG